MRIIVDAMGGDHAPKAPVLGAIQANKEYGVEITLVGRGEEILSVLHANGIAQLPAGVEIAHASEVVEICDNPATAFREKKDSSLTVGLNLLKAGEGDAFVSAGSPGARLSAATLRATRSRGIRNISSTTASTTAIQIPCFPVSFFLSVSFLYENMQPAQKIITYIYCQHGFPAEPRPVPIRRIFSDILHILFSKEE